MNLPSLKMVFSVLDRASAPILGIQRRLAMMSKQARRDLSNTASTVRNAGLVVAGAVAATTAAAVAQRGATADVLNALESLDIQKLEMMRKAAVGFSNTWSGTTRTGFLEAAYQIKSGIDGLSDEAVASTTTMAGLTAKATRGMVEDLAKTFATGHGVYRKFFESDEQYAEQFGAGIAAATKAFKTDGGKMSQAISSLGAEAASANVPLAEQLAVLGMLQQTMEPSEAGTSYRAFMASLGKATEATGQRFLDAQGNAMPMVEILAKLRGALARAPDKAQAWEQITKAFGGKDAVRPIKLLIERQEELGQKIEDVNEATKKGKAFVEETASTMNKGEGSWMKKMVQSASNLAEVLGKALGPVMIPLMKHVHTFAVDAQAWIEANPKLARTIMVVVGVLGGLAAAIGVATMAMAAFNMAAWANPITWLVVAIGVAVAAIIAAIVALYIYWDEFLAWWKGYWKKWGDMIIIALGTVATILFGPIGAIAALAALVINHWDELGEFFTGLWAGITATFDRALNWINDKLSTALGWIHEKVRAMIDWLPDWALEKIGLKVSAEASGPKGNTPQLPATGQAADVAGQAKSSSTVEELANQLRAWWGGEPRPKADKFSGKLQIELKGGQGVVTRYEQSGDADIDVSAGSAYLPA